MIGLQTEHKLAQLLKSIADGEKEIEVTRQVLAEQPDFEPYTAFKRIDRDANSSISVWEVIDFLRDNELVVLERDIQALFKVYDSNRDSRLNYSEFLNMVLPKTSPALRQLATQRESYYVSRYETLPYEVEWALTRVVDKEINYNRKIELLKEDLSLRYDFTLLDAFRLIDEDRCGLIDLDSIYLFFKRNHIIASESDILALLRRADQDGDGKLTYSEFVDCVSPSDPYYKSNLKSSAVKETRTATPNRYASASRGRMTQSTHFHSAQKKLSNLDYYDYLSSSAKKSNRASYSPVRSTNKKLAESTYESPSRNAGYTTPSKSRSRSPVKEYKSPLKEIEEDQLARALKEQINLERDNEDIKNQLALRSDFNLLDAFRFFDIDSRGYITKNELKEGFNYFGVFPTNDETYLIFRKLDTDNDGLLRYAEFCELFNPKSAEYLSILNSRVPSYLDSAKLTLAFSYETKHLVKKVLDDHIRNESRNEEIRQKLNRRPLFNIYESFKALDKNDNGFIDINEFRDALIEHGLYASTKEISNIVKRYDHNNDGKVSYYDFVQELTPKSPKKY